MFDNVEVDVAIPSGTIGGRTGIATRTRQSIVGTWIAVAASQRAE